MVLSTGRTPSTPSAGPAAGGRRPAAEVRADLTLRPGRRPLVATALLGGVVAAGGVLVVCAALGVIGWFLTDGGAHGSPRDGLRVGALAWAAAHGSGLRVEGSAVTLVPWGLTLLVAWSTWRSAVRVGEAVSGHGPDAARLGDGQRDLVVPTATLMFGTGYVVLAALATTLAGDAVTAPSTPRVLGAAVLLTLLLALPGIAVGSGRAAVTLARVPYGLREAAALTRLLLLRLALVALVWFLVALVRDFATAANVVSRLHADAGAVAALVVLSLVLLPNALACTTAYLLGPGFAVGTGTVVSTGTVTLGPLPDFPMLAALPDPGAPPGWTAWTIAVVPLVAALVAGRHRWRDPVVRWDDALAPVLAAGVATGLVLGLAAALAGGAVGPGRMREVGPFALQTTLHAVPAVAVGAVLGAAVVTLWVRRGERLADPD
ncbi:DUF6350 family protein [Nocardioides sp.]|uniref:cell division protein PerM n=1 Tax=Nocardioides sp. TaxID=35761 RepID=UPI003516E71E